MTRSTSRQDIDTEWCYGYWSHRAMHRFDPLWRVFHQMHHSAERVDTYGAFWFSPWDMVGWTVLGSLMLVVVGLPSTRPERSEQSLGPHAEGSAHPGRA